MGWDKRGHLSLIERGLQPTPTQAQQLRAFYIGPSLLTIVKDMPR